LEPIQRRDDAGHIRVFAVQHTGLMPKRIHGADALGEWRAPRHAGDRHLVWNGDVPGNSVPRKGSECLYELVRWHIQCVIAQRQA
jgi:hypothetical protein